MTIPPENRSLIDWFAVTFKVGDPLDAIRIIELTPEIFTPLPHGKFGYHKSLRCGNISVYFNGREEMGCHVEMSGQGCRQYEGFQALTWLELCQKIMAIDGNVTRLDLAIDTVDGSLPLDRLFAAVRLGEVRTVFSSWKRIESASFRVEDKSGGETLYLGSTQSSLYCRVYDKARESHVEGDWVRFELQLSDKRSQEAVRLMAGEMQAGVLAVGIINRYFAVIQKDDSNISRCPLQPWWESWLLSTEKIRLGSAPSVKTVDQTMAFIKKQYAPSLAMIHQHLGGQTFNAYLQDVLDEGGERMSAKHGKMLQAATRKNKSRGERLKVKTGGTA